MLNSLFDYENWINRYISRQKRKQITYGLSLLGIIGASFLAFQDIYLELQNVRRDLAKSQEQLIAKGPEEQTKVITKLQEANTHLETELRSTQQVLSTLQDSLRPRRLSPEERKQFADALALHDSHQFGVVSVATGPSCQECMLYRDEIVQTIMSVPGWRASGDIEVTIRPDLTGIVIGVKDPKTPPPKADIIAGALKAAKLPFRIGTTPYLSPDKVILIIGNKP